MRSDGMRVVCRVKPSWAGGRRLFLLFPANRQDKKCGVCMTGGIGCAHLSMYALSSRAGVANLQLQQPAPTVKRWNVQGVKIYSKISTVERKCSNHTFEATTRGSVHR